MVYVQCCPHLQVTKASALDFELQGHGASSRREPAGSRLWWPLIPHVLLLEPALRILAQMAQAAFKPWVFFPLGSSPRVNYSAGMCNPRARAGQGAIVCGQGLDKAWVSTNILMRPFIMQEKGGRRRREQICIGAHQDFQVP